MERSAAHRAHAATIVAGFAVLAALASLMIWSFTSDGAARAVAAQQQQEQQYQWSPPAVITTQQRAPGGRPASRQVSTRGLPQVKVQVGFDWPVQGRITSDYGWRRAPDGRRTREFHHGTDIACAPGTVIRSAAPGYVAFAGEAGAYGNTVYLQHDKGFYTLYGHMSDLLVPYGQWVAAGQPLGLCGSTGRATGPHLHLEIRLGRYALDPLEYLD